MKIKLNPRTLSHEEEARFSQATLGPFRHWDRQTELWIAPTDGDGILALIEAGYYLAGRDPRDDGRASSGGSIHERRHAENPGVSVILDSAQFLPADWERDRADYERRVANADADALRYGCCD